MPSTNEKIDRQLRRSFIRRTLVIVIIAALFIGFMSYALYKEYGPGAEMIDYFPEVNRDEQKGGEQ
jgi:hypothetical protein